MRNTRKESDNHAKRYPACEEDQGSLGWAWLNSLSVLVLGLQCLLYGKWIGRIRRRLTGRGFVRHAWDSHFIITEASAYGEDCAGIITCG